MMCECYFSQDPRIFAFNAHLFNVILIGLSGNYHSFLISHFECFILHKCNSCCIKCNIFFSYMHNDFYDDKGTFRRPFVIPRRLCLFVA